MVKAQGEVWCSLAKRRQSYVCPSTNYNAIIIISYTQSEFSSNIIGGLLSKEVQIDSYGQGPIFKIANTPLYGRAYLKKKKKTFWNQKSFEFNRVFILLTFGPYSTRWNLLSQNVLKTND